MQAILYYETTLISFLILEFMAVAREQQKNHDNNDDAEWNI